MESTAFNIILVFVLLIFPCLVVLFYMIRLKKRYNAFCAEKNIQNNLTTNTDIFSFFMHLAKDGKADKKLAKMLKFYKISFILLELLFMILLVSFVQINSVLSLVTLFMVVNLWIYICFKFNTVGFSAYRAINALDEKETYFIGRKNILSFCKENANSLLAKKALFYDKMDKLLTCLVIVFLLLGIVYDW